ncbi:MAG: hypothetical protein JWN29_1465 [Acidimicrobiales bacterium]|nr:hypothetical protein [Acidimicrobiales bacterium]
MSERSERIMSTGIGEAPCAGLELGHALITMIEPDRETLAAYNRWYERDHFLSGVLAGPGAFAGQRFVATRDLKQRRWPADSPVARPVDDGSFITLYWIERDQLGAHCDWGFPEAARLAGLGRMNTDRHHVSTSYYDLVSVTARDTDPVPAELALHHPYAGLTVVWSNDEVADRLIGPSVSQVVTFRPAAVAGLPGSIMSDPDRDVFVHCCFVDDLGLDLHEALAGVEPLLVAPFRPTVPGTETYLDELW